MTVDIATKKSARFRADFLLSRDDKIRTCGLFVPNEARYRAALHPAFFRGAKVQLFSIQTQNSEKIFSEGF